MMELIAQLEEQDFGNRFIDNVLVKYNCGERSLWTFQYEMDTAAFGEAQEAYIVFSRAGPAMYVGPYVTSHWHGTPLDISLKIAAEVFLVGEGRRYKSKRPALHGLFGINGPLQVEHQNTARRMAISRSNTCISGELTKGTTPMPKNAWATPVAVQLEVPADMLTHADYFKTTRCVKTVLETPPGTLMNETIDCGLKLHIPLRFYVGYESYRAHIGQLFSGEAVICYGTEGNPAHWLTTTNKKPLSSCCSIIKLTLAAAWRNRCKTTAGDRYYICPKCRAWNCNFGQRD